MKGTRSIEKKKRGSGRWMMRKEEQSAKSGERGGKEGEKKDVRNKTFTYKEKGV